MDLLPIALATTAVYIALVASGLKPTGEVLIDEFKEVNSNFRVCYGKLYPRLGELFPEGYKLDFKFPLP